MNTPHKHCEIIKAWADGIPIQIKNKYTNSKWKDCTDIHNSTPFFGCTGTEFRIKPETIKYRVGLFCINTIHTVSITTDESTMKRWESLSSFVRWITDWIEVEV